jgi:hypothetical protein
MASRRTLSIRWLAILGIVSPVLVVGCGGGSTQNVAVTISPLSASVVQGGTENFTATVTGSSSTAVNWSVQEGAAGGSITSMGRYTAPNAAHQISNSSSNCSVDQCFSATHRHQHDDRRKHHVHGSSVRDHKRDGCLVGTGIIRRSGQQYGQIYRSG